MTVYYVDDTATGADDGTSWTDAWPSLQSALTVAAGSEVRVASTHNEAPGSAYDDNWSNATTTNPISVISCNTSTDAYSPGAYYGGSAVGYANSDIRGNGVVHYGMTYEAFDMNLWGHQQFIECELKASRDIVPSDVSRVTLRDCDIIMSGPSSFIRVYDKASLHICGGTIQHTTNKSGSAVFQVRNMNYVRCDGVDFSQGAGTWTNVDLAEWYNTYLTGEVILRNCQLKSGWTVPNFNADGGQHLLVRLEASDDGTVSAPVLGLIKEYRNYGTSECDSTRYRTGGATDGETAYSLAITPDGTDTPTLHSPLQGPPITLWIGAGASQTITIYFASGATQTDKTLWFDVYSPSEAGTATTLHKQQFGVGSPSSADSANNHTTDGSSTWNGTGVATKQKATWTISPTEPGVVSIIPYLAGSNAVYIDPKIVVS